MSLYEIENIEKEFKIGAVPLKALSGITLTLEAKSFVSLVGASGSGKSTLLNILGLLETPSQGRMSFLGYETTQKDESVLTKVRRELIGFVFQNFNLISVLSALENVEYPLLLQKRYSRSSVRKMATEMLGEVGLSNFIEHKPAQLSGGQRQRVAIARALVKRPKVVLADEPTANLDSNSSGQILELMKNLQKTCGTTLIIATHDLNVASLADKIVVIKDGKVSEETIAVKIAG